ncbi:NADP-dependent oxidoreductase [Pseudonocardia xinjiangensis]|uniref:NADP-dependent oxidoreductase n=1 Tax=Pseudonocardia xinjiangensis TaxID=75289 RepID=A0ABX1RNS7_9PSEU|nr:NADP-dependent oxidoreductase [Pseudonocardia xinjiangensis]
MMAMRAHTQGGPDVLVYESAPRPTPEDGEVLIAVHAAAITFDELAWPETWASGGVDRTPIILSHEFSGVVAEVGDGVTGFSVGDEVYGLVPFDRDGAAAEYVSVPVTSVAARPRTVSHVVAAAAVLPALTAWEALVEHAAVQPGQRVLVHGGAGGVGSFLTQLATALGASVTATVHAPDVGYALSLGVERVINTDQESLDTETGAFDVVIDAVGRDVPEALFAALRRGGRLITLQEPPPEELADKYGVTALFFIVTAGRSGLARIAGMIDAGKLMVGVAATFPLAEGRAAYESGAVRRSRPGKTVLVVRD